MADDQRLGKGTVTIRILPRALRVIAPETTGLPDRPATEERAGEPPKVVVPQATP